MKATIYALTLYLLSVLSPILFRPTVATKKSYVVYMGSHSHGREATSSDYDRATESHYEFLGSFLGSSDKAKEAIFYSYNRHINGFAATLEHEEASRISEHPKVVSVFLNQGKKLHTTRSWDFLGLEKNNGEIRAASAWKKARFGEDAIIGNIDTGVWPESKSFSDEGLGPIPSKWRGICQNGVDKSFCCNRKLIGARYFNKGYSSAAGPLNSTLESPRDTDGHGTHTLSTAGSSFVPGASVFGFGNGTAKGGSPRARLAAYKVCWPPVDDNDCFDADILAAFDMAIHDGVDVLSVSLGDDPVPFYNDSIAIGSFHAVKHGIAVVCSAGNSGPDPGTVENAAPWLITVGASTMDRQFPSYVILGNNMKFKGESLSDKSLPKKFFGIISARYAKAANATVKKAEHCSPGSLNRRKVKGKILVCLRGGSERVDKGERAILAGAVGMVLASNLNFGNDIEADAHVLPASHINYTDGRALFSYIRKTRSPVARITKPITQLGTKPSPFVAAFSSAGPNTIIPEILKPDIVAPGVSIIAAYAEAQGPTNEDYDKRRVKFNSVSGTSTSCPHVSGVVGLLKTLHPNWSPAAIKSAIMTTARTEDNTLKTMRNASYLKAVPFNYGGGHVQPNRAMDPGLVYDISATDYLDLLCAIGYNQNQIQLFSEEPYTCPENPINLIDFNNPAITVPNLDGSVTVTRKLKNVGPPSTYKARVLRPPGISIQIEPDTLGFESVGEEKSFSAEIQARKLYHGRKKDYVFGQLIWSDGKHYVRSPIVVKQI